MTKKTKIDYEIMVQDALRGVMREALTVIARSGLPSNHHLYISYHTNFPGVDIPDYLHDEYPEEITIVLQYEFWDLEVERDRFHVTLCFNDIHERLTIPFAAVSSFVDPSVKFGLQFDVDLAANEIPADLPVEKKKRASRKKVDPEAVSVDLASGDSNVITLDAFRKK